MKGHLLWALAFLLLGIQCKEATLDTPALDTFFQGQQVHWNKELTRVMVADIFTPPVCSRIYAYPNIAAYEAMAAKDDGFPSFAGTLKGLDQLPQPEAGKSYYYPLASILAFATVARELVYGQEGIDSTRTHFLEQLKTFNIPKDIYQNSLDYGTQVGNHILAWSKKDGYLERTSQSQYVVSETPGRWKPTPPDYMPAIEPHWSTLRTFVLDSATQFRPLPPTAFSNDKNSVFYKETMHVYQTVKALNTEQKSIAKFWDCNPNVSHTKGHLMFFDQKISPGGHWVSIAGIAINKKKVDFSEATKIFALTSITLADAFISCWEEKYRSSLVRPETYINEFIDQEWKPLLQTPAFPEHTSGHSVISSAAAVMLTELLGDNFSFHDDTEVEYGLPARDFPSFYAASGEAAISRLYGGIHYMPAIENGVEQGKDIGQYILKQLKDFL